MQPLFRNFSFAHNDEWVGFADGYHDSKKQPDVALRVKDHYWLTLVAETGWLENHQDLLHDKDLWLLGGKDQGSPPVNVVVLVYFDHKAFDADKLHQENIKMLNLT